MDPNTFSADKILSIKEPEQLFNPKLIDVQFNSLRLKWHPDRNHAKKANDVFSHISKLKIEGDKRTQTGTWARHSEVLFTTSKGSTFRFSYLKMTSFEIGKMYIGNGIVLYVIDEPNVDLFENGVRRIKEINYPNTKMKEEFPKYFPRIKLVDKNSSIGPVLVITKNHSEVLLQDLINFLPEKHIHPLQTAWIVSSLYNIVTFLDFIGICHNGIISTNIFIDIDKHAMFLYGGWWYATKTNDRLKAFPSELLKILPREVFNTKKAKTNYDRQAVRGIGLECLGDPTLVGSILLKRDDIPKTMLTWLRQSSGPNAIEEYDGWMRTLEKCYGKRSFVKFPHDVSGIYR